MEPRSGHEIELVKVFETGDAALIPVVESLLNSTGIEYLAKNQRSHEKFPGTNYVLGPVEYWVASDDAADVRELLADLAPSR